MPSLCELQESFAAALLAAPGEPVPAAILAGRAAPATRFALYRRSVLGNYRRALKAIYPVVANLVGDGFFEHAADAYARSHPSRSGDLNRYGEDFADFLRHFPPAAGLAYLPDTARLDWAMESVFHAADPVPADLLALARVAEADYPALRFRLAAHCRLIESRWPLDRLWLLNQPGVPWDDEFDIEAGGVALLVHRRRHDTELRRLAPAEHALLASLAAGQALGEACQRALELAPKLAIAPLLHLLLCEGTLQLQPSGPRQAPG